MQQRTKLFVFVAVCHFAKIWDGREHPLLLAMDCEMSSCVITNTNLQYMAQQASDCPDTDACKELKSFLGKPLNHIMST